MNNPYNPNRRKWTILIPVAIILASTATLYCVPQILQAERFEDRELRNNRQRIEKMTKLERDRLRRRFEEYQALSDDRKETYRKLHQALLEDRKQGGNLTEVMENYDKWLLTLSLQQVEDIQSSKSDKDRKELVDIFLQEQKERREEEERRNSRSRGFRVFSFLRNSSRFQRSLSSNSVSGKMKLSMDDVVEIARLLQKELKIDVKIEKLKSSENKYLVVLSDALIIHKQIEQEKKKGCIDDDGIVSLMEKCNANPNFIARIKKSAENSTGNYDVLKDVFQTIRDDWRDQYQTRKEEYLESLPQKTRNELKARSPRDRRIRLEWMFFRDNAPEYTNLIRTYYSNLYLRNRFSRSKKQRSQRSGSGNKSKRKLFR